LEKKSLELRGIGCFICENQQAIYEGNEDNYFVEVILKVILGFTVENHKKASLSNKIHFISNIIFRLM